MVRIALVVPVVALASCGGPEEEIAFNSRQEQACFERVSATLPADKELRRSASGSFVEVLIINNQMRDAEISEAFESCMATVATDNSLADLGTVRFTAEELALWETLTDDAKRDALIFIQNGGTLAEFVAS